MQIISYHTPPDIISLQIISSLKRPSLQPTPLNHLMIQETHSSSLSSNLNSCVRSFPVFPDRTADLPMNDQGFFLTYLPMHILHSTFQVISTGFILRLHVVAKDFKRSKLK